METSEEYQKIVDLIYTWDITNINLGIALLKGINYDLGKFAVDHFDDFYHNILWYYISDYDFVEYLCDNLEFLKEHGLL